MIKKLLFVIGLGLFLGIGGLQAQSCSSAQKSGSKCCAKSTASTQCVKPSEAALKAASMDASIETKVCEKSGSVCFKKKSVDAATGEVNYNEVRYDEATASFVNYTPDAGTGNAKACCKGKKSCAKSSASTNVAPGSQSLNGPDSNKE